MVSTFDDTFDESFNGLEGMAYGIDIVISNLNAGLDSVDWLVKKYGRAFQFLATDGQGVKRRKPKVYVSSGEYVNVLPNDDYQAQSFWLANSPEKFETFERAALGSHKTRDLSLIIWVNLKSIDPLNDSIFTEDLKKDISKALMYLPEVVSVNAYKDEKVEDIFSPFYVSDVADTYLMYPYAGMRFDITVKYFDSIC